MPDPDLSSSPTRGGHSGTTSPAEGSSSTTNMSPQAPEGGRKIEGASGSNNNMELQDPKEPLEEYDWEKLEGRFTEKMDERQTAETEIYKEFNTLLAAFTNWAQCSSVHEGDRAFKRLRTRMSYVQNAEHSFEEKRQHYIKVVKAFESALALLGES